MKKTTNNMACQSRWNKKKRRDKKIGTYKVVGLDWTRNS
jgi:hypothetical protein